MNANTDLAKKLLACSSILPDASDAEVKALVDLLNDGATYNEAIRELRDARVFA